jgi:hypothetical protein
MTLTPTWWQPSIVLSWSWLVVVCGVAAATQPDGYYSFGALLLLWLLAYAAGRSIRMEVTETMVRVKRGWLRGNPVREVARSRIQAIHYYPKTITFRGPAGGLVMRTKAEWSLKQMIAVAAELQVPVYDNRQCLNLLPAKAGRLAFSPSHHQWIR